MDDSLHRRPETELAEEKGRHYIALALRIGSYISTTVMAMGLGLLLGREVVVSCSPAAATGGFWGKHTLNVALAVMHAGILLLLLTPIFRIVVAGISFAIEGDHKYVLVALGVLLVILLSIGFSLEA